jgi:hypothetical protein
MMAVCCHANIMKATCCGAGGFLLLLPLLLPAPLLVVVVLLLLLLPGAGRSKATSAVPTCARVLHISSAHSSKHVL